MRRLSAPLIACILVAALSCGGAQTRDEPAATTEPSEAAAHSHTAGDAAAPAATAADPATPATAGPAGGLHPIAKRLVESLTKAGSKRVAVVGLTTVEGEETRLGKYLADKLLTRLGEQPGDLALIERAALKKLIAEQKFTHSGLTDPDTTAELGKLAGAEALILGTVTVLADSVDVNVRAVATESGRVLGTADAALPRTGALAGHIEANASVAAAPPLTLTSWILGERQGPSGYEQIRVTEGAVLHSGDGVKISFETSRDAYVYVFLLDSRGQAALIFPNEEIAASHQVRGGREVVIPTGDDWFFLDENTGTETIYVTASLGPMPDVQGLLAKLEAMGPRRDPGSADQAVATFAYQSACQNTRGFGAGTKKSCSPPPTGLKTRGFGKGFKQAGTARIRLSDGKEIEQSREMLTGTGAVVKVVSFQHR